MTDIPLPDHFTTSWSLFWPLILVALGLIALITKRTLLGLMVGVQLLFLGTTSLFAISGVHANVPDEGFIVGLFILLAGVGVLILGMALSIRLFFLRERTDIESLKTLKN